MLLTSSPHVIFSVISFNLIQCIKSKINNTPCPNKCLWKSLQVDREKVDNKMREEGNASMPISSKCGRTQGALHVWLTLKNRRFVTNCDLIWIANFSICFDLNYSLAFFSSTKASYRIQNDLKKSFRNHQTRWRNEFSIML